jgi:DNA sulfur modification protein DndB
MSTMTFEHVANRVEKIDDQLHKSDSLKELIQRSLTKNFESIKEYINNQPERFFNSIVLAVYNDSPNWVEVELKYEDEEYFNLGFLDFSGTEKLFPVDGQHRVEGIKAALKENSDLKNEQIGVLFIGHSKDEVGMQKSRRLFTTLNRYAKPVTMDDIIALDEDDSVAIVTRDLLEEFDLFTGTRVTKSKNKAIPDSDKKSITSIITLYQCNYELLKQFRRNRKRDSPNTKRDNLSRENYLKFRPDQVEIDLFNEYCKDFWQDFKTEIQEIQDFSSDTSENPATEFRNKDDGGNLLFRPVGLLPFVQVVIEIHKRTGDEIDYIINKFSLADFTLNTIPWKNVLWNPNEKTMIMGTSGLVKLLLLYMYNDEVIRPSELRSLSEKYSDKMGVENEGPDIVLQDIPLL